MEKVFYLFIVSCLFSCNNKKEHVYNETLARVYYEVSDMLESSYKKLTNNEYQTAFEKNSEFHKPQTLIDAQHLKGRVASSLEVYNLLEPSDAAEEVHAKTGEYFNLVNDKYVSNLEFLGNIDCDCPEKKDSVIAFLKTIYQDISQIEDEMLELQKQYFETLGMTGAERE